jgi:hypothetical protein
MGESLLVEASDKEIFIELTEGRVFLTRGET